MTGWTQHILACAVAHERGIVEGRRAQCDASGIPRADCTAIACVGPAGEIAWVSHAHADIDPASRVNPSIPVAGTGAV